VIEPAKEKLKDAGEWLSNIGETIKENLSGILESVSEYLIKLQSWCMNRILSLPKLIANTFIEKIIQTFFEPVK